MKLHAFVALLNGKKTKNLGEIGELHKRNQKAELFNGKTRTYRPLDDADEKLPAETVARSARRSIPSLPTFMARINSNAR